VNSTTWAVKLKRSTFSSALSYGVREKLVNVLWAHWHALHPRMQWKLFWQKPCISASSKMKKESLKINDLSKSSSTLTAVTTTVALFETKAKITSSEQKCKTLAHINTNYKSTLWVTRLQCVNSTKMWRRKTRWEEQSHAPSAQRQLKIDQTCWLSLK